MEAEHRFGSGKGAVVVPLRGGRYIVAGFAGEGGAATYRDNVSTWLLDEADALHGPTRIREAIGPLATLGNGDALAACALDGQIQLYRLDRETGGQRSVRLPLPECQRIHPATLFLTVRRDGTVLLGGSRPGNHVGENCSWLGRLSGIG